MEGSVAFTSSLACIEALPVSKPCPYTPQSDTHALTRDICPARVWNVREEKEIPAVPPSLVSRSGV